MQGRFFESKAMQMLGRIGDIMLLNIVYVITCLPIVTIGAATAAMYTVCFRFGTVSEGHALKTYFKAFGSNFKQGTVIFLILLVYILCAGFCTILFYNLNSVLHYAFILFALFGVLGLTSFCYAFPLISQFENRIKGVLYNSFVFSVSYFPKSLLMAAMTFFPVILFFVNPYLYDRIGLIWYMLYYAVAACANVQLLRPVFAPFMPEPEKVDSED